MLIKAKIEGVKYKPFCCSELRVIDFCDFDINKAPTTFTLNCKLTKFGVSRWVSPKRTRSYPFERVYNTLDNARKITIIPVLKDEGALGDRDFLQWDTISLMSLLDIYVIPAFYDTAIQNRDKRKINAQKFNVDYINKKILEIQNFHSSALHWNLKEINENLEDIVNKSIDFQTKIERSLGIKMHNLNGIEKYLKNIKKGITTFISESRTRSSQAQNREFRTTQPNELLNSHSKAKLTIKNYLGGEYHLTVDETRVENNQVYLIEDKHRRMHKSPSIGDIKDGLLKMVLYSNFKDVTLGEQVLSCFPTLRLTSSVIVGSIDSSCTDQEFLEFFKQNNLNEKLKKFYINLFCEAKYNNFFVIFEGVKNG